MLTVLTASHKRKHAHNACRAGWEWGCVSGDAYTSKTSTRFLDFVVLHARKALFWFASAQHSICLTL